MGFAGGCPRKIGRMSSEGPTTETGPRATIPAPAKRPILRWLWAGAIMTALGGFLLLDPTSRAEQFLSLADRYWPFVLVALAGLNTVRVLLPNGSWIAPGLLGSAGLLGWFGASLDFRSVVLGALPLVLVALGVAALARAAKPNMRGTVTAVILSRNAHLDEPAGELIRARAYVAELRLDLTQMDWERIQAVEATAVLGRVRLSVPHQVRLRLEDGGAAVYLRETGSRALHETRAEFRIHGVLGRIDVVRG